MRHLFQSLLLLSLFISFPVFARSVDDISIPDSLDVSGSTLQLNGAGIRKKFFMDIYIGALYLPARTPDSSAVLSDNGPAAVLMHIQHSEISQKKITQAWIDGLQANLNSEEMQQLQPTLDKFNALFTDVHKGDEIRIDYSPASGTTVSINNQQRGTVGDNTFFRSLLRVWIGNEPVSDSLKNAMLGLE